MFCRPDEIDRLGQFAFDPEKRMMSPAVVGRSAEAIAEASGIDIPDGATVNAVYATWTRRGGGDGATYAYSEGANSNSLAQTHTVNPTGDLVRESRHHAAVQDLRRGTVFIAIQAL